MSIELRNLIPSDKDLIFAWISNPELRRMTGTRGTPNIDTHEIWFKNKINDTENLIKVILSDNKPVGIIGTNKMDRANNNADIYLYIGEDSDRGKGIGSSALKSFIDVLFSEYECHKITATVYAYNKQSIALFKKVGFKIEGRLVDQVIRDGIYCDQVLFGYINPND